MPEEYTPDVEVYVYATNKNFLNVYDVLARQTGETDMLDKLRFQLAQYSDGYRQAYCYLDRDEARMLMHAIAFGLFSRKTWAPGKNAKVGVFQKFSGSTKDGKTQSRTLTITWDPGADGGFAHMPYQIVIANGPGKVGENGQVMPNGKADTSIILRLPEFTAMSMALEVLAYLAASDVIHFKLRGSVNQARQAKKVAERNG